MGYSTGALSTLTKEETQKNISGILLHVPTSEQDLVRRDEEGGVRVGTSQGGGGLEVAENL